MVCVIYCLSDRKVFYLISWSSFLKKKAAAAAVISVKAAVIKK